MISQHLRRQPGYCHSCGNPFPWTVAGIEAAKILISEMDELSEPDKETLKSSLGDLVSDTPKSAVAAERYKKIVKKLAAESGAALKQVAVGLIVETWKKIVYPS
jgi:hypothetical protein